MIKTLIASGLVVLVLGWLLYAEINSHAKTTASLANTVTQLNKANNDMLEFKNKIEELKKTQVSMEKQAAVLGNSYAKAVRDLSTLRDREEVAKAKSTLWTLKINAAYMKHQLTLACSSGDTTACAELKQQ